MQRKGTILISVAKNIAELKRMIDDLLNVSRAQMGNFTMQPLRISCSDRIAEAITTLHSVAAEHKINLTADIESHLPHIHAGPGPGPTGPF